MKKGEESVFEHIARLAEQRNRWKKNARHFRQQEHYYRQEAETAEKEVTTLERALFKAIEELRKGA